MLKYFLEQNEPNLDSKTYEILQDKIQYQRCYTPFHLDCAITKNKLCYCTGKTRVAQLDQQQRKQLWKSYEKPHLYYSDRDASSLQRAEEIYEKCRNQIRALSKNETAEFIRNLKKSRRTNLEQGNEAEH